jgi:hypothetical protein
MKRSCTILLAWIIAALCLSVSATPQDKFIRSSREIDRNAIYLPVNGGLAVAPELRNSFQDHTQEITDEALALIKKNQREGAPLDQRWYGFRRFGQSLEFFLTAREVRFYGGREADVRSAIARRYVSLVPLEANQDPRDIRLFKAQRNSDSFDLVIIGQNGREVALKTMIRLAYLFEFMDERAKQRFVGGLDFFLRRVKIFLSSFSARQEFIAFFHQYHIADPDIVIIGFQRDTRAVLKEAGISEPERHSSDSLRVNWYPDAGGKKVLLVSINGNRIFAGRAGELIQAIFETFHSPPQSIVFLGSAGAIDSADLVGQIVAPTVVVNDDYFNAHRGDGKLAHIIRNRATLIVPVKTAHVSVESMLLETMPWATKNKSNRIMTVDQELYPIVNAINTSPYGNKIQLFVGILVTDNVSAVHTHDQNTLQHAEDLIAQTGAIRKAFLAEVLSELGITRHQFLTARPAVK